MLHIVYTQAPWSPEMRLLLTRSVTHTCGTDDHCKGWDRNTFASGEINISGRKCLFHLTQMLSPLTPVSPLTKSYTLHPT